MKQNCRTYLDQQGVKEIRDGLKRPQDNLLKTIEPRQSRHWIKERGQVWQGILKWYSLTYPVKYQIDPEVGEGRVKPGG